MVIILRTDEKINGWRPAHHFRAFGLGNAAGNPDEQGIADRGAFVFQAAQATDVGVDLVGSFFADVTGVEENQISQIGVLGRLKAFARQRIGHAG